VTLTGHLTATNGGQPLAGVSTSLIGQAAITDGAGTFRYSLTPGTTNARLDLSASGIVPRSLLVAIGSTRDVAIDAIGTAGFDLNSYRAMVRNGFEAPTSLERLRRWTINPQFYLRTLDDAGVAIDARTLNTTEQTILQTVPLWTAGHFTASVIRGTETRAGQAGWITVTWPNPTIEGFCGRANVALEGGSIELNYRWMNRGCGCNGVSDISPRIVRHELGHAMGFWHSGTPGDVMISTFVNACDLLPTARELAIAAIAYQRPVGNTDPDTDPVGAVTLRPLTAR
jgi:hypothetical protein